MARTLKSDRPLFLVTVLLVGLSIVMVYSASAVPAEMKYQASYLFLFKQLAWALLGVGALLSAMRIDYHAYRRPIVIWSLVAIVIVGLIAVFLFHPVNGTRRWIQFAGLGTIQPSELAKLAAILFAAALLDRRMHRIDDIRFSVLPIAIVTGAFAALIVREPDYGTAVVLVLVVGAIVFAAGLRYKHLAVFALVMVPIAVVFVLESAYRMKRWEAFIHPWEYAQAGAFQVTQSIIAIGSGGVLGKGLMAGVQKLFYVPEPQTDFIYSVIGEELGLVGTTLVLMCFVVIAWRGLRASVLAPDRFGALLALGLTTMVTLQALVNISVVTGLVPDKGIPLPFVSNGGSSLLINIIGMGMLLNISQQASRAPIVTAGGV